MILLLMSFAVTGCDLFDPPSQPYDPTTSSGPGYGISSAGDMGDRTAVATAPAGQSGTSASTSASLGTTSNRTITTETDRGTFTTLSVTTSEPIPTAGLSASPTSILSGQLSTLSWTTTNANVVTLNGTSVPASGSLVVYPQSSTTYTLTAQNAAGSVTSSAAVTVISNTASSPTTSSTTTGDPRDPALWPFAATSPWNYPIGSNAIYALTNLGGTGKHFGAMQFQGNQYTTAVYIAQSTDPILNLRRTDRTSTGGGSFIYSTNTFSRHVPSGAASSPGENQISIISPDHLIAFEGNTNNAGTLSGNPISIGAAEVNLDLKGNGWNQAATMSMWYNSGDEATPPPNSPYNINGKLMPTDGIVTGAGLPWLGGLIRSGELTNGINHAMAGQINPDYYNRNAAWGFAHVWPATNDEAGSFTFATSGNIYEGSLLAIPASVNLAAIGLQTTQGMNIARALQRYGIYLRDSDPTAGTSIDLENDANMAGEIPTSSAFLADLNRLVGLLQVVTNSHHNGGQPQGGIKLDAGDGTLLAPLAPPFNSP